jgi:hypothetical protein
MNRSPQSDSEKHFPGTPNLLAGSARAQSHHTMRVPTAHAQEKEGQKKSKKHERTGFKRTKSETTFRTLNHLTPDASGAGPETARKTRQCQTKLDFRGKTTFRTENRPRTCGTQRTSKPGIKFQPHARMQEADILEASSRLMSIRSAARTEMLGPTRSSVFQRLRPSC